jgi:hypothetical protein
VILAYLVLGAVVAFIVWGSVVSIRRRLRLRHATGPDFESFASFYTSNPLRRGDDVAIGHLDDEGYRWDLAWLPRTQEVAAFCVGWSNERAHIHTSAEGVIQLSATPGFVRVLGTAFSSEEATRRIAGHLAIDEIRSLFAT